MKRLLTTTLLTTLLAIALATTGHAQDAPPPPAAPPATPPAAAPAPAADAVPTVKEVTRHLDTLYRSKTSHGVVTMKVKTRHFDRTMSLESWSIGEDQSLMVIRKPARESGSATLRTDEGLWQYAPRADRLIRIPSGMLGEAWMGSHFTNDDLMRESSWEEDYDTTLSWVTEDGQKLLKAEMIPKKDAAVVFTKVNQYMLAEGWLPYRVDYFDGDEIVRKMHFSDIRELGGKRMPAVMKVVPTDKPNEHTTVIYERMTFDGKVDKKLFTPRGLRKAAQRR